jgi:hypothetical protein
MQHLYHLYEVKYFDFFHLSVGSFFLSLIGYFEALKIYSKSDGFPEGFKIFWISSF